MASFSQLPSGKWRAQIRTKGVYKASTFNTKREAQAWAAIAASQAVHMAASGIAPVPAGATVADLIAAYRADQKTQQGRTKQSVLNMLSKRLGHVPLAGLNSAHLREYVDKRLTECTGQTLASDLSFLSAVLHWARFSRALDVPHRLALDVRAGLSHRGVKTRSNERSREPTAAELQKLYAHWDANARQHVPMTLLTKFALATGLRLSEITGLRVADVDLDRHTVVVRDRKDPQDKIGNDQTVPLIGDAFTMVAEAIGDRQVGYVFPYNAKSIGIAFARTCTKLGIVDLHFHDLRHCATSQFFRMGLGIPQVALLTGHKSWATLKRYTRITAADVFGVLNEKAATK